MYWNLHVDWISVISQNSHDLLANEIAVAPLASSRSKRKCSARELQRRVQLQHAVKTPRPSVIAETTPICLHVAATSTPSAFTPKPVSRDFIRHVFSFWCSVPARLGTSAPPFQLYLYGVPPVLRGFWRFLNGSQDPDNGIAREIWTEVLTLVPSVLSSLCEA